MLYWENTYKDKIGNQDFIEGAIAAIKAYSTYRKGICQTASPEVLESVAIKEIKKQLKYSESSKEWWEVLGVSQDCQPCGVKAHIKSLYNRQRVSDV